MVHDGRAPRSYYVPPRRWRRLGGPVHTDGFAAKIGGPPDVARTVRKRHHLLTRQKLRRAGLQPPVPEPGWALLLRGNRSRSGRRVARRMALLLARPGKR